MDLDHRWLVLHLARGGWVKWKDKLPARPGPPEPEPPGPADGIRRGSGFDVTEMGTEKRLALWVVGDPEEVEGLATLGVDPLDAVVRHRRPWPRSWPARRGT